MAKAKAINIKEADKLLRRYPKPRKVRVDTALLFKKVGNLLIF
jgi:hypothetical protein